MNAPRPIPDFLRIPDPRPDLALEFQHLRVVAANVGLALTTGPVGLGERAVLAAELDACVDRLGGLLRQLNEVAK